MQLFQLLAAVHDAVTRLTAILSALCLAGIVALYCGEVVMRYFLDRPTSWTAAVSVYLLLSTVMLMMPRLTSEAEHVSASIVDEHFSPRAAHGMALAIAATAALICGFATWFSLSEAARSWSRGVLTTDTLYIPKWWLLALVVYGLGSSTLHFLRHFLHKLSTGAEART